MTKVLIVEDDPDILFTMTFILKEAGYDVEALSTGKSILEENYNTPDIYILDKRMPDMDGLDVCRHIRSQDRSKNIPVIVISASPKFGPQALHAGANDFIEKPFHMTTLIGMIDKYANVPPSNQSIL
jgi:DNA-binding response OmpR family regulator